MEIKFNVFSDTERELFVTRRIPLLRAFDRSTERLSNVTFLPPAFIVSRYVVMPRSHWHTDIKCTLPHGTRLCRCRWMIWMLSRGDRITNLLVLRTANLFSFFFYIALIAYVVTIYTYIQRNFFSPNVPFIRSSIWKYFFTYDFLNI